MQNDLEFGEDDIFVQCIVSYDLTLMTVPVRNRRIKFSRLTVLGFLHSGEGRNRIGRREKWPKQSWEEGEIGGKVGRREKLAQKVGRREIYLPVPPPPPHSGYAGDIWKRNLQLPSILDLCLRRTRAGKSRD